MTVGKFWNLLSLALLLMLVWSFCWLVAGGYQKSHSLWDIIWYSLSLFEDSAEYAPGYSDSAFMKLKSGDSMAKVFSTLGLPLEISGIGKEGKGFCWRVSDGGQDVEVARIKKRIAADSGRDPNNRLPGPRETWYYSQAGANDSYWFRILTFDSAGRLVYKDGHYFMD